MGIAMARARVSTPLADPVRLSMLRATGMLGSPPEEAFDRLAGLARKILKAPVGMVALLDDRHLHVKACVGRPELAKARRVPATESFCQHVVATEEALVVDDAREHELTRDLDDGQRRPGARLRRRPAQAPRRLRHRHALGRRLQAPRLEAGRDRASSTTSRPRS